MHALQCAGGVGLGELLVSLVFDYLDPVGLSKAWQFLVVQEGGGAGMKPGWELLLKFSWDFRRASDRLTFLAVWRIMVARPGSGFQFFVDWPVVPVGLSNVRKMLMSVMCLIPYGLIQLIMASVTNAQVGWSWDVPMYFFSQTVFILGFGLQNLLDWCCLLLLVSIGVEGL